MGPCSVEILQLICIVFDRLLTYLHFTSCIILPTEPLLYVNHILGLRLILNLFIIEICEVNVQKVEMW